jgi:hypothetical protein
MKWNIFKRLAELEANVRVLLIAHAEFVRWKSLRKTILDKRVVEYAKEEDSRQIILQQKREYYQRNKEQILQKQRDRRKEQKQKEKIRQYNQKYYMKRRAIKEQAK